MKFAVCHPPKREQHRHHRRAERRQQINETGRSKHRMQHRIAARAPGTIPRSTSVAIAPIFSSISTLCTRLPAFTPRQFTTVSNVMVATATNFSGNRPARQFQKVARERYRDRRHAAGLNHQQQHPSVQKSGQRMKRVAQVCILPAHIRHARRQLGIDERAQHRHHAARHPHPEDQHRRMDLPGHNVRIDEDARADDAAHDDHGGVEQSDTAQKLSGCRVMRAKV